MSYPQIANWLAVEHNEDGTHPPHDHAGVYAPVDHAHEQYHTKTEADERYYTQEQVDALLAAQGSGPGPSGALIVAGRGVHESIYDGAHVRFDDYPADQDAIMDAIDLSPFVAIVGGFHHTAPAIASRRDLILMGMGFDTQIRPVAGFPDNRGLIEIGQTSTYYPNISVENLCLDGDGKYGSGVDGIRFNSYRGRIFKIWAQSFSGDGIHLGGDPVNKNTDGMFGMLQSGWCGGVGVNGAADTDCHYQQIIVHGNTGGGLNLGGASQQVSSVHAYSNGNYGIRIAGAFPKITLCKIEWNDVGALIRAGGGSGAWNFQITSSHFRGAGDGLKTQIAVEDGTGASTGAITGNIFAASGPNNQGQADVAIKLAAHAQNYLISGNKFGGTYAVDRLVQAGSGHLINGNLGI